MNRFFQINLNHLVKIIISYEILFCPKIYLFTVSIILPKKNISTNVIFVWPVLLYTFILVRTNFLLEFSIRKDSIVEFSNCVLLMYIWSFENFNLFISEHLNVPDSFKFIWSSKISEFGLEIWQSLIYFLHSN